MSGPVRSDSVSAAGASCTIPYPDRFHAAHSFVSSLQEDTFNDETRLLLYALHKQATQGACKESKPWSFNVVDAAKWQSWSQLGNMSHMEAMRLYVKAVDEEQPEWWNQMPSQSTDGSETAGAAPGAGDGSVSISSVFQDNTWVVIKQDDAKKPLPRYEQGAALLGPNLYVMGGHYGGRYLQDMWVYNLNKLQWSAPVPAEQQAPAEAADQEGSALLAPAGPPAAAGWSVTPLGDKLLIIGGHVKVAKLKKGESLPRISVRLLDLATLSWSNLATSGDAPSARGGHAACLLPNGTQVVVFGGEDSHRRPLSDVYILDLQDLSWHGVEIVSKQQPAPRSGAAATLVEGNLLVFGGGSVATCYNDLWVLDLEAASWSKPDVCSALPSPRAGHSGALVGGLWYILGGGNNIQGITDMIVADLSELSAGRVSWSRVCSVPAGSPLSSEGISLLHAPEYNLLVAFGGYNGKYHNAVSVYKLPSGQQQQQQQHYEQEQQQQQQLQQEQPEQQQQQPTTANHQVATANGTTGAGISSNRSQGPEQNLLKELALSREQLKRDLTAARQELELVAGAAAAAKEEAAVEVNMLRRQLQEAQAQAAEASQFVEGSRHALAAEQAKTLKLEAQLAELSDKLNSVHELERELAKYRQKDTEAMNKKGSSGSLWGYIAGGTS